MGTLRIRLLKGRDGPDTLACVRADGSSTWHRLHPSTAMHDLTHYALETTLGLRDGVFGLIARGWDLADFESPAKRAELPADAIWEEFVVGLLQVEFSDGREDGSEEFNAALAAALRGGGVSAGRVLTGADLDRARSAVRDLAGQWRAIRPGEGLDLDLDSV